MSIFYLQWLVRLVHSWTLPATLASLAHRALINLKQDKYNVLPAQLSQDNLVSHNQPEPAALLTAKVYKKPFRKQRPISLLLFLVTIFDF